SVARSSDPLGSTSRSMGPRYLRRCMAPKPARTGHRRMSRVFHIERHRSHRAGWLRAAVLGANDGIVSTAALVLGVAAADTSREGILTAGTAGLVAGALSMAVGEYVSVSSQRDTELAD